MVFFCAFCTQGGEIIVNIFGNTVKHYLLDSKITQKEIAEKIGCNANTISQLLSRDNISLDKMLLIANALDCDLEINLKPHSPIN